jgi:mannose-1-phosphate guanylyltransferase
VSDNRNTWALVLAAGEGSRLRSLTTTSSGVAIPKQFCSLRGGSSLLHEALCRAEAVASRRYVCTVVAAQHRHWWEGMVGSLPVPNVIVQPANRGTANGILWPLLHIMDGDPEARIVVLPSDHHVEDEAALADSLRLAVKQVAGRRDEVLLLGIQPHEPDSELGYIVPDDCDRHGLVHVARFVEKPDSTRALELIRNGGLWNTFIMAATARALLGMFERCCPEIVTEMREVVQRDAARSRDVHERSESTAAVALYERLPTLDFSRHILHGQEHHLRALPVRNCGWSDLGTPQRVRAALRRAARDHQASFEGTLFASAHLNLAAQHERLQPGRY